MFIKTQEQKNPYHSGEPTIAMPHEGMTNPHTGKPVTDPNLAYELWREAQRGWLE